MSFKVMTYDVLVKESPFSPLQLLSGKKYYIYMTDEDDHYKEQLEYLSKYTVKNDTTKDGVNLYYIHLKDINDFVSADAFVKKMLNKLYKTKDIRMTETCEVELNI